VPDRPIPARLVDGTTPGTPDELFTRLAELEIAFHTVEHPPVFTVEQAKHVRGELPGAHTKSLFLRDKKGAMWLVACLEDRIVDLKSLADRIGAKRLSFGSPERLMRYLGVIPGAVSPFAVINDRGNAVRVVLDRALVEHRTVHLHPLDNAKTTVIAMADLLKFLDATGHGAQVIDFAEGASDPG
jgi:Ala-tRNA(Pro) deacylase